MSSQNPGRLLFALTITIFSLSFPSVPCFAQTEDERLETERRLQALQEQLEQDRQRLSQTAQEEQISRETLTQLQREIALREELTRTYQLRVNQLSFTSDSLRISIEALERDIDELKEQYRRRATHAYKYGRLHDLALILSAESINQMLIRANYLHRFTNQRRQKLNEIEQAMKTLRARREELQAAMQRNEQLLAQAREEEQNLERLRRDRNRVLNNLTTQRSELEEEIRRKEAAVVQLADRIRQLTATASSRQRENLATNRAAAAEYIEMSGSFTQNQGKLPWPSEGVVTERFGTRVSPIYGTTTTNPGILIATNPAAEVRSVFDGEVVLVDVMPEYGTIVSIAHGEYQTVYSNFSMVYINRGDRVRAGQVIGRAGTQAEPQRAAVFFAIFRNGQAIDPLPWLRPL